MCGIGLIFQSTSCCFPCNIEINQDNNNKYDDSIEDSSKEIPRSNIFCDIQASMKHWLARRGPNYLKEVNIPTLKSNIYLTGAVLHIQGEEYIPQPVEDLEGHAFLWNGEVFDGLDYPQGASDTLALFHFILESMKKQEKIRDLHCREVVLEIIQDCLSQVKGPYSFIFLDPSSQQIIFGRDPFGRRSLLINKSERVDGSETVSEVLSISSVSFPIPTTKNDHGSILVWEEIKIGGIYSLPYNGNIREMMFRPWSLSQLKLYRELTGSHLAETVTVESAAQQFSEILQRVLSRRLGKFIDIQEHKIMESSHQRKSKVGVLFSGGIDSLLLAVILHLTMNDLSEPIDLLNVAFIEDIADFTSAPDRLSGIIAYLELKKLFPTRSWRLVHVDVSSEERTINEPHIKQLINPLETHMDLNIGTAFWFASRGIGYIRSYDHIDEQKLYSLMNENGRPLVRIGEEGALLSKGIHPSDPDKKQREGKKLSKSQNIKCAHPSCQRISKPGCPGQYCKRCCDLISRQQIIESIEDKTSINIKDLFNSCPVHKSKSQKGNPSHLKLSNQKGEVISILEGEETEESDNFPSLRAELFLNGEKSIPYQTSCKVLLVGLGADEQLAGYGRHRTVFAQSGNEGLREEINKDLQRLWQRNLGRDDRCVSDHGREVWFPYLDEELVSFIQSLPLSTIADLSLPQGIGDKRILRLTAQQLGINGHLIQLVKRAIQFGTLAAKQTSIQYYGSRRKGKGESKI